MATKKPKKEKPADPMEALKARVEQSRAVLGKHKDKAKNDPKRRLAAKKMKRAQRGLGKLVKMEKKAAAAKAKSSGASS